MVKKLYKYELAYYFKMLSPAYIALLGVALLGRFVAIFENESVSYSILRGSTVFALVVAIIAVIGFTFAFSIIRYYKSMYSGEGYLTHTLPVKVDNLITVKLFTAFLVNVFSLIMTFVAVFLFTVGEWFNEIAKAAEYIIKNMFAEIPAEYLGHVGWYIVQMVLMLIVSTFVSILMYYMCISIGQLFNKNRILGAIGVYFGLYMLYQTIETVVTIIVSVIFADKIEIFFNSLTEAQALNFVHIVMLVSLVLKIAVGLAYYFVVRFINTKKLNLE